MYIPKDFEITDKNEVLSFIEQNSFGQLISQVNGLPFSTHLPFLLSEDNTKFIGHLAKQNPQAQSIDGQKVLVTLQGEHAYISPSWYVDSGVPTWNYQAVHIYGKCQTIHDPKQLKILVDSLTIKNESNFSDPWQPDYNESMLGAIVGFEISITEIQCKYKLHQNRSQKNQEQVIEQLQAHGAIELAEAMQNNINKN